MTEIGITLQWLAVAEFEDEKYMFMVPTSDELNEFPDGTPLETTPGWYSPGTDSILISIPGIMQRIAFSNIIVGRRMGRAFWKLFNKVLAHEMVHAISANELGVDPSKPRDEEWMLRKMELS